jgi:hypothetical protein
MISFLKWSVTDKTKVTDRGALVNVTNWLVMGGGKGGYSLSQFLWCQYSYYHIPGSYFEVALFFMFIFSWRQANTPKISTPYKSRVKVLKNPQDSRCGAKDFSAFLISSLSEQLEIWPPVSFAILKLCEDSQKQHYQRTATSLPRTAGGFTRSWWTLVTIAKKSVLQTYIWGFAVGMQTTEHLCIYSLDLKSYT